MNFLNVTHNLTKEEKRFARKTFTDRFFLDDADKVDDIASCDIEEFVARVFIFGFNAGQEDTQKDADPVSYFVHLAKKELNDNRNISIIEAKKRDPLGFWKRQATYLQARILAVSDGILTPQMDGELYAMAHEGKDGDD